MLEKAPFYLGWVLPLKLRIILPKLLLDSYFFLLSWRQCQINLQKTQLLLAYSPAFNFSLNLYWLQNKFAFKAFSCPASYFNDSVFSTDIRLTCRKNSSFSEVEQSGEICAPEILPVSSQNLMKNHVGRISLLAGNYINFIAKPPPPQSKPL